MPAKIMSIFSGEINDLHDQRLNEQESRANRMHLILNDVMKSKISSIQSRLRHYDQSLSFKQGNTMITINSDVGSCVLNRGDHLIAGVFKTPHDRRGGMNMMSIEYYQADRPAGSPDATFIDITKTTDNWGDVNLSTKDVSGNVFIITEGIDWSNAAHPVSPFEPVTKCIDALDALLNADAKKIFPGIYGTLKAYDNRRMKKLDENETMLKDVEAWAKGKGIDIEQPVTGTRT